MALLKVFDPCAICLLCLVLSASELCNGGITGNFLRKEYSPDMPLDSDVFQVPPGYNAPQQFSTGLKIVSIRIVQRGFLSDISSSITLQGTSITAPSRTWRRFWFKTPPRTDPDVPYTFGLIGNHELDFAPQLEETTPFKPYMHRYYVPYASSHSTSPLWYSIKRGSAYLIVLSSYSAYGKSTPQYKWLRDELPKVDRSKTPWLIVLCTAQFILKRISNIAYNIVNGMCTPVDDQSAPVYITIGDGGNHDGPAIGMVEPQPSFSAYRKASFGHGIFDIKNRTHAYFSWHRNQDRYAVEADSFWFHSSYWNPLGKSFVAQY
ncbi:Purple acid phosphatase 10 isoform 2 [Gossypium australe]|uniref:Purple acid phosphatase 10 isoform 2 n=1 Tax=Gossypium australe TaxID=47621 RepID=A0A5B6X7B2_9ROSI|nr:Purple acid phosphatase 10 isoform 2 [Gossypium australe]